MPFICRVYTPPTNFTFSQHPFPSASGSSAHYTYGPKKAFKKYSLPLSEILHTVSFFNPQASRVPEKLMITPCLRLLSELSTFKQRRYSHSHLCEQCFPPKTTSDTTDGVYVQSSKIRCEDKKTASEQRGVSQGAQLIGQRLWQFAGKAAFRLAKNRNPAEHRAPGRRVIVFCLPMQKVLTAAKEIAIHQSADNGKKMEEIRILT